MRALLPIIVLGSCLEPTEIAVVLSTDVDCASVDDTFVYLGGSNVPVADAVKKCAAGRMSIHEWG